jgi:hypothetical protein
MYDSFPENRPTMLGCITSTFRDEEDATLGNTHHLSCGFLLSRINSKFFKKKKSALLHILSNVPHNNVYIYINWVTHWHYYK